MSETTISPEYQKAMQQLHADNKSFGNGKQNSDKPPRGAEYITDNIKSIIDYGCGKSAKTVNRLREIFPDKTIHGYDPGIPQFAEISQDSYDMLVTYDVLEHFEPDLIDGGLKHVNSLFTDTAFILVACNLAKKKLPDGRNAHLIVEGPEWWLPKLREHIQGELIHEEYLEKKSTLKNGTVVDKNKYITVWKKEK